MKVIRVVLIVLLVIGLSAGAFFLFQRYQQAQAGAQSTYQTLTLENGDLTATVGGTGIVRANQTAIIAWQTTGTVEKVSGVLGAQVAKGDILATLDKTSLPQNVVLAQADLVTAQKNLDTLKNPTALTIAQAQSAVMDAQTALDNLKNSLPLTVAQAEQAVASAQKEYTNARNARSYLDIRIGSQDQIDKTYAQMVIKQDQIDYYQKIFDRLVDRPQDDTARAQALANLSTAKADLETIKRNLAYLQGKGTAQDFADADARLTLAKARLDDAQRQLDDARKGIKPDSLNLAEARVKDAQDNLEKVRHPQTADIDAAQARVDAIQATLNLQTIRALFDGSITDIKSKVGDQVSPGAVAFRLDDLSHLLVDVQISEIDINRIAIDQTVNMTFDAIQGKQYTGKVSQVGKVGTSTQGSVNFTITIELTNADEDVRPGMTAAVNIIVNQLQGVLLVPNRAVRLKDSQRVVYLLKGNTPTAVDIELGATAETYSQLLSGDIKAGDQVVLNPPIEFRSGGGPFGGR